MNVSDSHGLRLDPAWWTRSELREALAERNITTIYQFLRARGFSQTRIAALTGQNQSEVSAILAHGRQVTAYDVLARIADGLRIPRGLMGLAYAAPTATIRHPADRSADRPEGSIVRRRAFMGVAAKIAVGSALTGAELALLATPAAAGPVPDRIGHGDVARIEDMTAALDRQELAFGGGSCREAIIGYLNWATRLRDAHMTDDVRRALDIALTHLEELAGWASYDLLLLDSAEHFYLRSLHSARLADYPFMAAKALARLGKVYLDDGQYGDALRMFHLATVPAREAASPRMTAYLHLHEALVHARQGNAKQVASSIRRAEDDYADADADANASPRRTRFLNDAGLHGHASLAYSNLAERDTSAATLAVERETSAMRLNSDRTETRNLLMHHTNLALNLYRGGDTVRANEITSQILTALPDVSSLRLITRLRPLAAEATRHDSTAAQMSHHLYNLTSSLDSPHVIH